MILYILTKYNYIMNICYRCHADLTDFILLLQGPNGPFTFTVWVRAGTICKYCRNIHIDKEFLKDAQVKSILKKHFVNNPMG